MATSNPIQKKSRISFILGMLLPTIILGAVIAFMFLQIKNYRDKEKQAKANLTSAYILSEDVKSGQVITNDLFIKKDVDKNTIPANAILDVGLLESFSLKDKEGNEISTKYSKNSVKLILKRDGEEIELKQEEKTNEYYIQKGDNKEYIQTTTTPIVAKVDMKKNTVLTTELIAKSDEVTTDDLRKQEYNMIILPSQIQTKDYIDIRLALPTGQDYIVVSKKQVTIPELGDGSQSSTDIWFNLTEEEIILLNNAIVDAYRIEGSKLYATTYVEAGTQEASTPTYIPNTEVAQLISQNPNIVKEAKEGLITRYNQNRALTREGAIDKNIEQSGKLGEERIKTKVDESITNSQSSRKKYLDTLFSGGSTVNK